MAYDTSNPPERLASRLNGDTPQIWAYSSADTLGTLTGSGYISDATNLGMRAGDVVLVTESDNDYAPNMLSVTSISSGAATLSRADLMETTAGTGITDAAASIVHAVERVGDMIRTTITIDLAGLRSTAAGDIIGDDGTSENCHIGQITAARNGTVFAGYIRCLEAPAGGDPDIDLYSAVEATGTEDDAITTLDETQLIDSGDHAADAFKSLTAFPAADEYLYLVAGATTDADYTAGILEIVMYGK